MNHKRRRPKNRRSGCLMCKPHKANGSPHMTHVKGGVKGKSLNRHEKIEVEETE